MKAPTLRTTSPRADWCSTATGRRSKRMSSFRGMELLQVLDGKIEEAI
jgi:hypothetical protein